jgi:hypothetical protein
MVDLLAFVFPMAGSILQLVRSDPNTQNSLFSFSVLFIFLHFVSISYLVIFCFHRPNSLTTTNLLPHTHNLILIVSCLSCE